MCGAELAYCNAPIQALILLSLFPLNNKYLLTAQILNWWCYIEQIYIVLHFCHRVHAVYFAVFIISAGANKHKQINLLSNGLCAQQYKFTLQIVQLPLVTSVPD